MASVSVIEQSLTDLSKQFIVKLEQSDLLGADQYCRLIIEASHKIVDELVKDFKPEIEEEFRKQIPELVKQMGNELIVKGLKQLAEEDIKGGNKE